MRRSMIVVCARRADQVIELALKLIRAVSGGRALGQCQSRYVCVMILEEVDLIVARCR